MGSINQALLFLFCLAAANAQAEDCNQYLWKCYGSQVSGREFRQLTVGPVKYVDNQDGVILLGGVVKLLEYQASRRFIPVRFMFFRQAGDSENRYTLFYEYTHIAQTVGYQKVELNVPMPGMIRIGFEVVSVDPCPIPFEYYKSDSSQEYTSYLDYTREGNEYVFPESVANRRYQFRVCSNVTQIRAGCTPEPPPTTVPTPQPLTECTTRITAIYKYGQGVPRIDGDRYESGGPYSMVDIDGAAQMPEGTLYGVEYRVWKLEPVIFQLWRPIDIKAGRMQLIYSKTLQPGAVEEVLEVKNLNVRIEGKDRFGFTYASDTGVPIKYSITRSEPDGKPYYALECVRCGLGLATGSEVKFDPVPVQKQFRMRVCMVETVTECPPPTIPPLIDCRPACDSPISAQSKLRSNIFCDSYDMESIPLQRYSDTLTVYIAFELRHMHFERERSVLKMAAIMRQTWRDYGLDWCPDDYGEITEIRISSKDIWTPDIVPVGGEMTYDEVRCDKGTLWSTGEVDRPLLIHFPIYCTLSMSGSTHEMYDCREQFASWMYDNTKLHIETTTLEAGAVHKDEDISIESASLSRDSYVDNDRSTAEISIRIRVDK